MIMQFVHVYVVQLHVHFCERRHNNSDWAANNLQPYLPADPGFTNPSCFSYPDCLLCLHFSLSHSLICLFLHLTPPLHPPLLFICCHSPPSLAPPIPCSSHCVHVLDAHWPPLPPSLLVSNLICCYWPSQLCSVLPPSLPLFLTHISLLPLLSPSIPVSLPLSLMEWLQRFLPLGNAGLRSPVRQHTHTTLSVTHTHLYSWISLLMDI